MEFWFKWEPEGLVCLYCGAPNPDRGYCCGNCGENPFVGPKLLTSAQLEIKKAVNRRTAQSSRDPHIRI